MKKQDFLKEIKDILLIDEDLNENTGIEVDSMASLLLIAFLDENFNRLVDEKTITSIKSVSDIVEIVGKNNLE